MSDLPVLLSTRQAAAELGLTVRQVQRLAGAGELSAAFRFAGKRGAWLFRETDVRQLRADRRKET